MDHQEIKGTILGSILILLFEFIGSTFLTLLFVCYSGVSERYIISMAFSKTWSRGLSYNALLTEQTIWRKFIFFIGIGRLPSRYFRLDHIWSKGFRLPLQPCSDPSLYLPSRRWQVLTTPRHRLHPFPDGWWLRRRLHWLFLHYQGNSLRSWRQYSYF